jgi:tRNA-splicing ligase RtcB
LETSVSYKHRVVQDGDNHFVLPKIGDMKVEVHAYLSPELFQKTEDSLWQQAVNSASYPGVIGMYLMPDTHSGYGVPVGGVVVTEDTIIQCGSGYDISCGVIYMKVPDLTAKRVRKWDRRLRWVREVEKRVATGVGSYRPSMMPKFKKTTLDDILRFGAKSLRVDADVCERQYIPVPTDIDLTKISRAYDRALGQLGSVGGGNHFIEMQVDRDDGSVWVMIHCGSRGYGWQTANHYFYEGAELRGIPKKRREESWLRADEPLGKEYWAYHNSAANYAVANRHIIVRGVQEALQEVFNCDGEVYYEISHNLVQEETLVLPDGTTKKGFVHRKGATRAFPAGHPDLVGTKWEETGHPVLIPGSMLDGAAILFPLEGAYQTACSVNHGSGRHMARGHAKRSLEPLQKDIDNEMKTIRRIFDGVTIKGIVGNTKKTPLDECGHVYKDLDAVLSILEEEGIARIAHRMYPVANLKGMD